MKTPFVSSLSLLVLVIALAFPADGHAGEKLKVFLLAGQSNMDGRGDGSQLTDQDHSLLESAKQKIRVAYNHKPIDGLDVSVPAPFVAKKFELERSFGPELFFGIELSKAWPGQEFLFIKRSVGGTSLYGCWNPEWTEEKAALVGEAKSPKLYEDFIKYLNDVLSDYEEGTYEICGMLWVQGESDTGKGRKHPVVAESYGKNLQMLIKAVRAEVGIADLPFMMLQVGSGKVVEGMQEAASTLKNVSFLPQSLDPEAEDFLPKYPPPRGHYDYIGMKRIGEMFAAEYLERYAPVGGGG